MPVECAHCGASMAHKRAGAVYCSRSCKSMAGSKRRDADDPTRNATRYRHERERRIAYAVEYGRRRPEVGRAARAKRKALARNAGVLEVSARDWRRLCARHDWRCFYCGEVKHLTMDHVIPIIRGGRHSIGNLVPACVSCNSSKSRRFIMEWRVARRGDVIPGAVAAVRAG
jgi:5-methylcytosine-specific restriction endonuclease McrA